MSLGRGTLILAFGWVVQILALYCLTFWLGRTLGPEGYGTYYVVMSILLWIEIGAINGLPTAIQKFVSAHREKAYGIVKEASQLQFYTVTGLFIIFFIFAPNIGRLFQDSQLKEYLRIALWDVLVYGYFFIFMALQNGLRYFFRQTILIMVYSLSKLVAVIVLVTWMHSVQGAFLGNIVGSITGLILGILFVRFSHLNKEENSFGRALLLKYGVPVALFALAINLLLNVDLWFVKYYLGKIEAGYYGSAAAIARVPYFLFFALSATVLPSVSKAIGDKNEQLAQQMVWNAIRIISLLVIPLSLLTVTYGREIIVLLFDQRFVDAGEILRILIWGMSFIAFFYLMTTVINADNKPGISLFITVMTVVLDVLLNMIFIPRWGSIGAASATSISVLIGSGIAGIVVKNRFHLSVDKRTVLGIIGASMIVFLISQILPVEGPAILYVGLFLMGIYGGLILLMKIVTLDELFSLFKPRDQMV